MAAWALWIALPVVALGAKAPKADYATEGYSEYLEGNYAKAVPLLKKAVQQNPKNANVWLNLGRALAGAGPNGPQKECDNEKAWKYVAMNALNKAVALDRNDSLAKLKGNDPKSANFRDTAEYRKWIKAQGPIPKGDTDLTKFFTEESSWFLTRNDVTFMDLEPGGTVQKYGPTDDDHGDAEGHWRIKKNALEITLEGGKVVHYQLVRGPYSWELKGPEGLWEPGPMLRDCSEKEK